MHLDSSTKLTAVVGSLFCFFFGQYSRRSWLGWYLDNFGVLFIFFFNVQFPTFQCNPLVRPVLYISHLQWPDYIFRLHLIRNLCYFSWLATGCFNNTMGPPLLGQNWRGHNWRRIWLIRINCTSQFIVGIQCLYYFDPFSPLSASILYSAPMIMSPPTYAFVFKDISPSSCGTVEFNDSTASSLLWQKCDKKYYRTFKPYIVILSNIYFSCSSRVYLSCSWKDHEIFIFSGLSWFINSELYELFQLFSHS